MDKIGEVIEASTGEFAAQSYQLHWAPPLGSLVKVRTPAAPPVEAIHESPLHAPFITQSPAEASPGSKGGAAAHEDVGAIHESPLQAPTMTLYAVVCHAATGSLEPGRRAMARGRDLQEEEEVYRQNPQLARLLFTTFKALIVGYQEGEQTCHFLPPQPPRVHAFVYPCSREEVAGFTRSLDFLTLLLGASLPIPAEELVAACLRQAAAAREDGRAFLVGAGKELALLLAAEPARLNTILRKIRP